MILKTAWPAREDVVSEITSKGSDTERRYTAADGGSTGIEAEILNDMMIIVRSKPFEKFERSYSLTLP